MTILEKVNILILLVTISYIMALSSLLTTIDDIPTQVAWLITFLTSVGGCVPRCCLRFTIGKSL